MLKRLFNQFVALICPSNSNKGRKAPFPATGQSIYELKDPLQQELHEWLYGLLPNLGDFYLLACQLIEEKRPSSSILAAHCMREITNTIPSLLAVEISEKVDYPRTLDAISELVKNEAPYLHDNLTIESPGKDIDTVVVPKPLMIEILELVREHDNSLRNEGRARRLFAALNLQPDSEIPDVTVRAWLGPMNWAQKHAHLARGGHNRQDKWDQLETEFQNIEKALLGMSRKYFAAESRIDEILEQTNN